MKVFMTFVLLILASTPLSAQLVYSVSTDTTSYEYSDTIHVTITVHDTGSTPDTLSLTFCDITYFVDSTNVKAHTPCPLVVIDYPIQPHDSITFGDSFLPPFPVTDTLAEGNHAIVGKVGSYLIPDTVWIRVGPITVVREPGGNPGSFLLEQNYPNPFNPSTVIGYQLSAVSHVTLKVYDVLGREVATLVDEVQKMGSYEVEFDGSRLPSGVYFYRLQAGTYSRTKKLVLLK